MKLAKDLGNGWVKCPACGEHVDALNISVGEPFCPYCGKQMLIPLIVGVKERVRRLVGGRQDMP